MHILLGVLCALCGIAYLVIFSHGLTKKGDFTLNIQTDVTDTFKCEVVRSSSGRLRLRPLRVDFEESFIKKFSDNENLLINNVNGLGSILCEGDTLTIKEKKVVVSGNGYSKSKINAWLPKAVPFRYERVVYTSALDVQKPEALMEPEIERLEHPLGGLLLAVAFMCVLFALFAFLQVFDFGVLFGVSAFFIVLSCLGTSATNEGFIGAFKG